MLFRSQQAESRERMDPALRAAWIQARQAEAPASYDMAAAPDGTLSGDNAAQGFSVALDGQAVRLRASETSAAWSLELRLTGYGRPGQLQPLSRPQKRMELDKDLVHYRHTRSPQHSANPRLPSHPALSDVDSDEGTAPHSGVVGRC